MGCSIEFTMIPGRHTYFLIGFGQFPRGCQRPEIFRAIGENFFFNLGSNRRGRLDARTFPNPTPVKEPVTEKRLRRDNKLNIVAIKCAELLMSPRKG